MTLPALLLGSVLATLYGAIFHLWRGGSLGKLFLYLFLSWVGFWTGQGIAERMDWSFLSLGPLHFVIATLTSWIFMLIGYWLSLIPKKN
jgi:hypothetical protein